MSTATESLEEGKPYYSGATVLLVGPQDRPGGSVPAIATGNTSNLPQPLFVSSPALIPLLCARNFILMPPCTAVNSFSSGGM